LHENKGIIKLKINFKKYRNGNERIFKEGSSRCSVNLMFYINALRLRMIYLWLLIDFKNVVNKTMVFILVIGLTVMPVSMRSIDETNNMSVGKKVRSFESAQKRQIQYQQAIKYIKKHEGFSSILYLCSAGKPTIGYGHVVKENEKMPSIINHQQAEYILRKDFDVAMKYASNAVSGISGAQKVAVAHFIFSLGVGRFMRSDLRETILAQDTARLDSIWLQYCNYRSPSGRKIRSEYALKMRQWELTMFKQGFK